MRINRRTTTLQAMDGRTWRVDFQLLRKQTVEPVFGIIKQAMGWRQMRMHVLRAA